MIPSLKTNKRVETGLIIRKETVFSKMQRIWNTIFFKEEISILQKIEKYLLKSNKPNGKIIIPKEINKRC